MPKVETAIKNLEKKYQQKYGVAVFSISVKKRNSGFEISGQVLSANQKQEILDIFAKENLKLAEENIIVLSDANSGREIGWVVAEKEIADLKSRFVSNKLINERILKRIRCSQALRGEILRVLFEKEDQLLVQQNDLTLGWVNKSDVSEEKENLSQKWKNGNMAVPGGTIKNKVPKEKISEEARKYLDVEYVLGGRSRRGIDCSGLVQVVYKSVADVILPRHSWDQLKAGKEIELKNAESGDLVFLTKKGNCHKHVGLVEKTNKDIYLIHASLDEKKVIRQEIGKVLEKYDFVQARRIVSDDGS